MLDLLLLTIGIAWGSLLPSLIILPLFYGVPKSIFYAFKGLLRKSAAIFYLKSFVLWNLIFIVAAAFLFSYFPDVRHTLSNSESFFIGQWLGIGMSVLRIFTRNGRKSLDYDFWRTMIKYLHYRNPSFIDVFLANAAKIPVQAFSDQAAQK